MTKPYVMCERVLSHYPRGLVCRKCGRSIEVGEEVVVPHVGKCYHRGCFDSCFV